MDRKFLPLPSKEYLDTILNYNPDTGYLTWKSGVENPGPHDHSNKPIGLYAKGEGYLSVKISRRSYLCHRIIWKMMTGKDPSIIDHKDLNVRNNAWSNLRESTESNNGCNRRLRSDNSSGYKGIFRSKNGQGWVCWVHKNNVRVWCKTFYDLDEAIAATAEKRAEIHGEFARNG